MTSTMYYPNDFSKRVRELYPNDAKVQSALAQGDLYLGKFLAQGVPISFPYKIFMSADMPHFMKASARKIKEKMEIYNQWKFLYKAQGFMDAE